MPLGRRRPPSSSCISEHSSSSSSSMMSERSDPRLLSVWYSSPWQQCGWEQAGGTGGRHPSVSPAPRRLSARPLPALHGVPVCAPRTAPRGRGASTPTRCARGRTGWERPEPGRRQAGPPRGWGAHSVGTGSPSALVTRWLSQRWCTRAAVGSGAGARQAWAVQQSGWGEVGVCPSPALMSLKGTTGSDTQACQARLGPWALGRLRAQAARWCQVGTARGKSLGQCDRSPEKPLKLGLHF